MWHKMNKRYNLLVGILQGYILVLATFLVSTLVACSEADFQYQPEVNASIYEGDYDVPVTIDLSTDVDGESGESRARALDFIVNEEEKNGVTSVNPHLDTTQFKFDPTHPNKGKEVTLIFVCTSADTLPVSVVKTTLYPEASNDGVRYPNRLRTKTKGGNQVSLAKGTDLGKGTWKMAIYVGAERNSDGTVTTDPNGLEAVKHAGPQYSDLGVDHIYAEGLYNLTPISKSAAGQASYTEEEKTSLDVPYMSDWITLTPAMISGSGASARVSIPTTVPLKPQGTLLRIQVRNLSEAAVKLAGMRLLTNSLAFRGVYDFQDDKLRANAKNSDLSDLFSPRDSYGNAYKDSIDRTETYPNYADFWVNKNKAETIADKADSKYYLIWAMPIKSPTDKTKSKAGMLHLLVYDAMRRGNEYNRSQAISDPALTNTVPRALIRKPALTRAFAEGYFRLSTAKTVGQYFRLHGVQTKIYNFLDYMTEDAPETYYTQQAMLDYEAPTGTHVAEQADWAGLFPVKLPDVGADYVGRYYHHYFTAGSIVPGKFFNSNLIAQEGMD